MLNKSIIQNKPLCRQLVLYHRLILYCQVIKLQTVLDILFLKLWKALFIHYFYVTLRLLHRLQQNIDRKLENTFKFANLTSKLN